MIRFKIFQVVSIILCFSVCLIANSIAVSPNISLKNDWEKNKQTYEWPIFAECIINEVKALRKEKKISRSPSFITTFRDYC